MTDPIRVKIQELVPDVMELRYGAEVPVTDPRAKELVQGKPITLAVVLRAIGHSSCKMPTFDVYGNNFGIAVNRDKTEYYDRVKWNLEHDNYDQQSEECKLFIGKLLGV